jgi:GNAT superfamily N-acetyltransferase
MTSHLLAFAQRARRRLTAQIGGQPLSDSFGRQQLKKWARIIQTKPKLILHDLGTKDGLTMYELYDTMDRVFVIYDNENKKAVAYGALERSWSRPEYKTMYNLYVDKDWRGKKLATVLHLGALHVYKKLMSDTTMAMGALNAFRSLEQHGYKLKMWDTATNKTVPFQWGSDGVPVVDGHSIKDAENYALYV